MTPDTIEQVVLIEAPIDVVWRTVTEPGLISQWFTDATELDLRPGGTGAFTFDNKATNNPFVAHLTVVAVDEPTRFSYRWGYPDGVEPEPGNSVLTEFTLEPAGDHTRLRVVESGIQLMPWSEAEQAKYVDEHTKGWARHLGDLQQFVPASR